MAIEHGDIVSKSGNPQHPTTCFSQVIDEDKDNQTLTAWRAEVETKLEELESTGGSGDGGGSAVTYTEGDGIKISDENAISVDDDYLDSNYCMAIVTSDTGTSRMQNETTGSGPMYRHVDGTYSYTGVHNGGADDIGVQTYVKNNETNVGTRINVYVKGAYYIPNMSNTDENYVADGDKYEIAVKGDLSALQDTLQAQIDELKALLESAAYISNNDEQAEEQGEEQGVVE